MSQSSSSIEPLVSKLLKVKKRVIKLDEENKDLRAQLKELQSQLGAENTRVKSIQGEYDRLKLAKSLVSSSGDKAEMKFRVNELVKEIDKCIALLNR